MGLSISSMHIVLVVTQRTASHDLQVRDVKTELLRIEVTHRRHAVWGQSRGRGWTGGTFLSGSFSGFPPSLLFNPRPPQSVTLQAPVAGRGEGGMAGADPSGCELKHLLWRCSLLVQLSHPYMTTGKTIALTRRAFVGKVMSLLFNTLSRLVIAFLPRSKRLLRSHLQSPSAVTV